MTAGAITVAKGRIFIGDQFVPLPEARALMDAENTAFWSAIQTNDAEAMDRTSGRHCELVRAIHAAEAWAAEYIANHNAKRRPF